MVKIAPSILAADFEHLEDEVKSVIEAGADYIHVDVMDGKFVPNTTLGIEMLNRSKKASSIPLDTHLMVENPMEWIEPFSASDILTFHIEALNSEDVEKLISMIQEKGIKVRNSDKTKNES